jgi:hypothetical protein
MISPFHRWFDSLTYSSRFFVLLVLASPVVCAGKAESPMIFLGAMFYGLVLLAERMCWTTFRPAFAKRETS